MVECVAKGERVVIEPDFSGHVGEEIGDAKEVMGRCGIKKQNAEGQVLLNFAKRVTMAMVNTYTRGKSIG